MIKNVLSFLRPCKRLDHCCILPSTTTDLVLDEIGSNVTTRVESIPTIASALSISTTATISTIPSSSSINILVLDKDDSAVYILELLFTKKCNMRFVHSQSLSDIDNISKFFTTMESTLNLVILDMSIYGARDVVRMLRLRYSRSQLPILISAASRYKNEIFDCMDAGANDFIYKPYRFNEVNYRVHNLLQLTQYIRKDSILSDILPTDIIQNLEQGINFIAKFHSNVTILFSDICCYTQLSSTLPTKHMIHILNTMFCGFDDICLSCGVYKVETIGDAYMIASGHDGNPEHIDRMLQTALRMLKFMESEALLRTLSIRIGIHTGVAHSGVIGKIRPRYCFFGDTVNVASRMESHGLPNTIQISDAVFNCIPNKALYNITPRGQVDIKGKGLMTTYLVKS